MKKNLRKSKYDKDKKCLDLFDDKCWQIVDNNEKTIISIKASFIEKRDDRGRSTLYRFDSPF